MMALKTTKKKTCCCNYYYFVMMFEDREQKNFKSMPWLGMARMGVRFCCVFGVLGGSE